MADPLPVDAFLAELDGVVAAAQERDRFAPAVRDGAAPPDVARRGALEAYHLARWTTPESAMLVANAPDVYAFTMDHAPHYGRWARELARRTGYLGDAPGRMTLALCRELGLDDATVRGHDPLPETIAAAFTMLYYVRRSYEEGLAVLAFGWDRCPAGRAHEAAVVAGLRAHYAGPSGDASPDDADATPLQLFRDLTLGRAAQERCRDAVRNVVLVFGTRVRAMNGWLAA